MTESGGCYSSPSPAKKRKPEFESWTEAEVEQNLRQFNDNASKKFNDLEKIVRLLKKWKTIGEDLKNLGCFDTFLSRDIEIHDCFRFREFLEKHGCVEKSSKQELKVFNDPIHGNIQLHPVCVAVMDTPQFQRLRDVKQLGLNYFVYPAAAHNRFEHSIGVCHLAGQFVRSLRENQTYLGISEIDCLCVELAGLCHDLGHGPFSHVFDGKFIPRVISGRKWKHEDASVEMFKHLVEENGLMKEGGKFKEFGFTDKDIIFIQELIVGSTVEGSEDCPHRGRPKEKAFLYEIVANKRNHIDVDKWDYFARDCHQLGFVNNFDHNRYIKFARVLQNEEDGKLQICMRDKEILNLYEMFSARYILHKKAYQHRVTCALEIMITQALVKANDQVKILGKNEELKMSECIDDMVAYTQLTDNILFKILDTKSEDGKMKDAKHIIERIFRRDLFQCVGEIGPIRTAEFKKLFKDSEPELEKTILKTSKNLRSDTSRSLRLKEGDFFVQIVRMDFGMEDENPVEKLNVYSKEDPEKAKSMTKEEISNILAPSVFEEKLVRIYSCDRKDKQKRRLICESFEAFYKKITEGREQGASVLSLWILPL